MDYVQIKDDEGASKFIIQSALPREIDFLVWKKDKHVKASAKKWVVTTETSIQGKQWANIVRQSVSFEKLEELEKKAAKDKKSSINADARVGLPPPMRTKSEHSWRNRFVTSFLFNLLLSNALLTSPFRYAQPRVFDRPY